MNHMRMPTTCNNTNKGYSCLSYIDYLKFIIKNLVSRGPDKAIHYQYVVVFVSLCEIWVVGPYIVVAKNSKITIPAFRFGEHSVVPFKFPPSVACLLYTSDAAD